MQSRDWGITDPFQNLKYTGLEKSQIHFTLEITMIGKITDPFQTLKYTCTGIHYI